MRGLATRLVPRGNDDYLVRWHNAGPDRMRITPVAASTDYLRVLFGALPILSIPICALHCLPHTHLFNSQNP
ncbi:hypothetical protein BDV06DRAFT_188201 [Aspergillus oleicola]